MRGEDRQQHELFSYGSLEERVPADHPLRPIRQIVEEALKALDGRFEELYEEDGRKSIPLERLLRALLVQMLYSIRSERMLMEQLDYNLSAGKQVLTLSADLNQMLQNALTEVEVVAVDRGPYQELQDFDQLDRDLNNGDANTTQMPPYPLART